MRIKRKGVSPVVATVLLLLLTIGGVSIIAGIIVPFVKDSLTKSTSCLAYRDYFRFATAFSYNCYKPDANNNILHAVTIKTDASSELAEKVSGFELVFLKTGSSKKIRITNGSNIDYNTSGVKMIGSSESKFAVPLPGETMSYLFKSSEGFGGVEIYPVIGSNQICDKTDAIGLSGCASSVTIP